jgi:nicotinamidase-related amidase
MVRRPSDDDRGHVPDRSETALLLIDVISDFEFEDGARLLRHARPMAKRLAELKRRARRAGVPAIYVNDNFGRWQSDFRKLVAHCLSDGVRGEPVARLLRPLADDYFVLKPKHSAFYSTTLDTLLAYLGARRLIICGLATDACVLFTASDAYMRDLEVVIPRDCVAAISPVRSRLALTVMERSLKADTRPSGRIRFKGQGTRDKERHG